MSEEVQIKVSETFASKLEDEFVQLFDASDTNIVVETYKRSGLFNTIEWAIPATLCLIVAKPFFTKFMEKLGEASADAVIELFKKQFTNSKAANERLLSGKDLKQLVENQDISEVEKSEIGRKIAPFEINVHHILEKDQSVCFRMVFSADMDEKLFERALCELATNYEALLSSAYEQDLEFMPPMNYQARTISLIYLPTENSWLHSIKYVAHTRFTERSALSEKQQEEFLLSRDES